MIVPRLRSEARGGSSSGSSSRYSNSGVYAGKIHGHHGNDPDLKRALQYSYTSQTVRKWEKRWVVIHETSMRVHKWMPAPVSSTANQNSKTSTDKIAPSNNDENNGNNNENSSTPMETMNNNEPEQAQQQEETSQPETDKQTDVESQSSNQESNTVSTQDTQMLVDEESTSQSSQP